MKIYHLSIIILLVLANYVYGGAKMTGDQGFEINSNYKLHKNSLLVQGELSTFVNCGSQYATWRQFPGAIQYKVIDLESNKVYTSINMMLSISEDGNEIFEHYSKEPCSKIVSKDFSIDLSDIYFQDAPKIKIVNFEFQAEYLGHKSNVLKFVNIPLQMNSF